MTDNSNSAKEGVHALFTDFRKAFDLVDHGILLRKLAAMNVTEAFRLWIRSFLKKSRITPASLTKLYTNLKRVHTLFSSRQAELTHE